LYGERSKVGPSKLKQSPIETMIQIASRKQPEAPPRYFASNKGMLQKEPHHTTLFHDKKGHFGDGSNKQ